MTHCISDKSIKKDNACMHHGPSFSAQGSGPRGLGGRAKNKEKQLVTGVSNFNFFPPPPFPGARTLDPDTGNSRRIYFLGTRGGTPQLLSSLLIWMQAHLCSEDDIWQGDIAPLETNLKLHPPFSVLSQLGSNHICFHSGNIFTVLRFSNASLLHMTWARSQSSSVVMHGKFKRQR